MQEKKTKNIFNDFAYLHATQVSYVITIISMA